MALCLSRVIITIFFILGIMFLTPATSQANGRESKRVLVLHSYHQGYSWTDNITRAVQQQFAKSDFNVELYIEYMDSKRLQPESVFPHLAALYEFKYSDLRFDAILSCDNNALDFLLQYRPLLFQNVPVVFCGINNFKPSMLSGHDDFTGVFEQLDVGSSLELIIQLHPSTRQVAVVSDATTTSRQVMKQVTEAEGQYSERLSFVHLAELRPKELAHAASQLPKDTAVLLLTYLRDPDGTSYPISLAPEIIRNHSQAPIYALWSDFIVTGVVGGLVTSSTDQGALTANLIIQLFNGVPMEQLPPPKPGSNSFLFNYQELQRLGLALDKLPAGSVVVNEPQTFYYHYRTGVWVAIILFSWLILSVLFLTRVNYLRRQTAQAIQAEKEFAESILDGISVPLFYRDTNGVYLGTNHAGVEFFGFDESRRDLIGKTSHEIFSKEVADKADASDQQLIASGGTQCYERVMINAAGQSRHVIFNKALFFDSQSTVAGIVGTMLDITELKQAQQLASRFGRILDSSLEEIYMADACHLNLIRTTFGSRQNLGYSQDELSTMTLVDLLPQFSLQSLRQQLQPLCNNEQQKLVVTSEIQRKDGSCYPVELHLQHTEIEGDSVIVVMARDVTERVKLERLRNEMLSMVSHELRTPLTGMLGFTEYLLENDPPVEQRIDCLQTLYSESLKLQQLIDDLLNLQRLKARQDDPCSDPINVGEVLAETLHLFSHASQKHSLQLECEDQLPQLTGNSGHLMQVLKNLISNAIKYSPDGGIITLGAKLAGQAIQFWVNDEGMGISAEDQKLIFDHFYRVDNSDGRMIGGTGLGLALVKEMVLTHGGTVEVESTIGEGSRFTFTLPLTEDAEQ